MEANELRIGNITKQGTIRSFYEHGIHVGFGKCHNYSEVEPIPLTEEWLLKMSFVKGIDIFFLPISVLECEIHAVLFHGEYVIELHNHIKAIITEAKYVHHVQNLFHSLCLQELTIK